jgi:hypothetical protein
MARVIQGVLMVGCPGLNHIRIIHADIINSEVNDEKEKTRFCQEPWSFSYEDWKETSV